MFENEIKNWTIKDLHGDSDVEDIKYQNGVAECIYYDDELDKKFKIEIETDSMLSHAKCEKGSVHIEIMELKNNIIVDEKSDIYIAPKSFGEEMKAYRNGLHLAFGKKKSDYPYFLKISGYNILLACPVKSIDDIKVNLLEA